MKRCIFTLACLLTVVEMTQAQNDATFKEYFKTYVTYPFSDPNPIPPPKKIYPYFRFDGFSQVGVNQEWKVVVLENDYIRVQIMPEIGGKIWTAMDKRSGKHFFYNNEVVKFRDIAMRGPWVSGGIEVNYGIIGHTPNSATPVDYLVRNNSDGSVSCFTSTLDLLTRTRWVLEIKLEKDKAYFTTRSFWFNSTGMEQPYYTWMNAGIPVGEGLRFLYPGSHSIGHGGEARAWPIDQAGRNLSYYEQNDFGGSKSYHILGKHSNYFGAFWEEDDFGMIHFSRREDKLGKKIFLWAQSGSGKIWEELLTDNSGQYVEIQSGRLFNQNQFESSFTPFKQIGFAPYSSDNWEEYWYPFKDIGGFSGANLMGAYKINKKDNLLTVNLSPVQFIRDSLFIHNQNGDRIASAWVKSSPLETVRTTLTIPEGQTVATLSIRGETIDFEEDKTLSRPTEMEEGFERDAAYGLYLQGRDLARFRQYQEAELKIRSSLDKDPLFLPALVEMTKLKLFRMQYDSAFYFSKKALSIDTYDGAANYFYGKAASHLSRKYDALDGFEVASLTPQFRNAAYTALAEEYMRQKDWEKAKLYAFKSLASNQENMQSLQLLYLIGRLEEDFPLMKEAKAKIQVLNPLNHFLRFEAYLQLPSAENRDQFAGLIQNELPVETYLELAIGYANLGRYTESRKLLELAPQNAETLFWLAWLTRNEEGISRTFLEKAYQTSPAFVFPFREESAMVFKWAADKEASWQADYLLALIEDYRGNSQEALERLKKHATVDFAPFYLLRARLWEQDLLPLKLEDVNAAIRVDPEEWRYSIIKSGLLAQLQKKDEAIRVLQEMYNSKKNNYIIGLELVRLLINSNKYPAADKILSSLMVLPFEGATDARRYYRETKLMMAHAAWKKKKFREALARIDEAVEWPTRLGVGKPFPDAINEDLENWMRYAVLRDSQKNPAAQKYLERVNNKDINDKNILKMIQSISDKEDKRLF